MSPPIFLRENFSNLSVTNESTAFTTGKFQENRERREIRATPRYGKLLAQPNIAVVLPNVKSNHTQSSKETRPQQNICTSTFSRLQLPNNFSSKITEEGKSLQQTPFQESLTSAAPLQNPASATRTLQEPPKLLTKNTSIASLLKKETYDNQQTKSNIPISRSVITPRSTNTQPQVQNSTPRYLHPTTSFSSKRNIFPHGGMSASKERVPFNKMANTLHTKLESTHTITRSSLSPRMMIAPRERAALKENDEPKSSQTKSNP